MHEPGPSNAAPVHAGEPGARSARLTDGDVSDTHGAGGVGAGEGEDLVQFLADGRCQCAVTHPVDEDDAAAAVLEILAEDLAEVVELEVQGGPFGDAFATRNALNVKVYGEVTGRVFQRFGNIGLLLRPRRDGGTEAAVFIGIDGDELAADDADGETVELQLVVPLADADERGGVTTVHQADLLADDNALVPGMLFLLAPKLHGTPARLILLHLRLRRCHALFDDAKVFEIVEFHDVTVQS